MSLSIEVEWIAQPHALDELERRTWADLRIFGAGRCISRVFDRTTQSERRSIFVPVFSIAEWLVENWWALLYEPSPSDDLAKAQLRVDQGFQHWQRRHCLRSAESGLLLPHVYLFGDGEMAALQWLSDSPGSFPTMPGEFTDSGRLSLSRDVLTEGLRSFVSTVCERVQGLTQSRVQRLIGNWNAITQITPEEAEFCRCAGRIGLDPFATNSWEPAALSLLETELGDEAESPMGCDFLESINDSRSALAE